MHRLADSGNTVVVIEHNLDVIKTADYIIDMGPDGGDRGGQVVACGTPEEVAEAEGSYTGKYVKKMLTCGRSHDIISSITYQNTKVSKVLEIDVPIKNTSMDADFKADGTVFNVASFFC